MIITYHRSYLADIRVSANSHPYLVPLKHSSIIQVKQCGQMQIKGVCSIHPFKGRSSSIQSIHTTAINSNNTFNQVKRRNNRVQKTSSPAIPNTKIAWMITVMGVKPESASFQAQASLKQATSRISLP